MKAQDFETYRKENKLTIDALCNMIGVPYITYYGFVRKNKTPRIATWKKFEKFYNENIEKKEAFVSIEEIFTPKITTPKTEKVYLDFPEDVTSELVSGNEIFCEGTGHTLKLLNGLVVRYSGDYAVSVGGAILSTDKYYTIKPIPLKLEVGKKYVAKDGRVATVFASDDHIFYAVFDNDMFVRKYNENGNCRNSDCDKDDLITEKE